MSRAEGCYEIPEGSRKDCSDVWTPDLVEGRMVEAIGFLDRVVPSGRNPFAKDGPWTEIRRDWDVVAQSGGEMADYIDVDAIRDREARGHGGLNTAQYDRMAEALEWVTLVQDRKGRLRPLIGVVLHQKLHGGNQVDWADARRRLRSSDTHDCLRMSYNRALSTIAVKLTGKRVPVIL